MSKQFETQPVFGRTRHIHMVGIGGIGMSGMAEILIHRGYKVTGSDGSLSETTRRLEELGATIFEGHAAENIEGADVVVFTSAVKADENVETKAARETNSYDQTCGNARRANENEVWNRSSGHTW